MESEKLLNLVGSRVREARYFSHPKLTQVDLASKLQIRGLNIDQSQVSKIESGIRPVSDLEVVVLARLFNVSSSWLLGETDNPQRLK